MGRKPNNTSKPNITVIALLDMVPEQMKEAIRGLTPSKIAKLRAEVQSKLDQAQYLNNVIDAVLKESSPEYYAAINHQPNKNSLNPAPGWQSAPINNTGVGLHPFSLMPPAVDPGQGYTFEGDPLPISTVVETEVKY